MPEEYITGSGKRQRGIVLCGLNVEQIRRFVIDLEALSHAIDETDWARLEEKSYMQALNRIEQATEVMAKSGCRSPNHLLFDPTQKAAYLKLNIKSKYSSEACRNIRDLLFTLLKQI